jgi:hypothetical protein
VAVIPFTTSVVPILVLMAVGFLGGVSWRLLVSQNRKLDRITAYLFTASTTPDGIPGPPGKLAQQDAALASQDVVLKQHTSQLARLDRGQVEILRRLQMSNGDTIADGVEALTSGREP